MLLSLKFILYVANSCFFHVLTLYDFAYLPLARLLAIMHLPKGVARGGPGVPVTPPPPSFVSLF